MKYLKHLPLLFLSCFSHASESATLNSFSDLRWENRLVIINEPADQNAALATMKAHTAEIDDRDIIWFILSENKASTNYSSPLSKSFVSKARQKYRLKKDTVTLIGKDGGIKSQRSRIDIQTLFSTIDAMPMRQHEMRQN